MDTGTLTLILLVVAAVLAGIALIQAEGRSLVAWAALLGFAALVIGRLA